MARARVLLLNAALGPLDYRIPHGMTARPGSIVVAPLGPRQLVGVVWDEESFPDVETVGDNRLLEVSAPQELAKYIARKGSITVNGVSLTTNAVDGNRFTINLIPHTLASTTLGGIRVGDRVNLEIDLIARYVERMLNPEAEAAQNA